MVQRKTKIIRGGSYLGLHMTNMPKLSNIPLVHFGVFYRLIPNTANCLKNVQNLYIVKENNWQII